MNPQAETLFALAYLAAVAAFALAGALSARGRRLEMPSRMIASAGPSPAVRLDVSAPAANDEEPMRLAA